MSYVEAKQRYEKLNINTEEVLEKKTRNVI